MSKERKIKTNGIIRSRPWHTMSILPILSRQARISEFGNDLRGQGSKRVFAQVFNQNFGSLPIRSL
jgi:hypothetical protein